MKYDNPEVRTLRNGVYQLLSIAFVPTEDVTAAYDELYDAALELLIDIMEYFNVTYVKRRSTRSRRRAVEPRYPPQLWNQ